jgi:hypothetical protein
VGRSRGAGVGLSVGVAVGVDVAIGITVAIGVGVNVGVGVGVGVLVAVGVGVGVSVAVGVGVGPMQKISIELSGVTPSLAYPPASQMWPVAAEEGTAAIAVGCEIPPRSHEVTVSEPNVTARIVDVLLVGWVRWRSPAAHDIHLRNPFGYTKLSARVSPVALGMLGMVVIESATGSYLNESLVSTSVVPFRSLPPPV